MAIVYYNIHMSDEYSVVLQLGENSTLVAKSVADYVLKLDLPPVDTSHIYTDFEGTVYADKNSLGYRSPEFLDADIVYAGCSQTWGVGIPDRGYIWGSVIANELSLSYANISGPGWSTEKIVRMIFAYLATNKKPKYILCLFPNITRSEILIDERYLKIDRGYVPSFSASEKIRNVYPATYEAYGSEHRASISKRPHGVEHVNTALDAVRAGMQSINILRLYCVSLGIEFHWSSWDGVFRDLASTLDVPEYIPVDVDKEDGGLFTRNCHQDYKLACEEFFTVARDKKLGEFHAHMGAHEHLHYANAFLDKLQV